MAPGDGQRRMDAARIVVAAITHLGERVLAIQRFDGDEWLLPGGPVTPGEDAEVTLRRYVRGATGFEIRHLTTTGCHRGADGVVEFIRCEIRGVGSDITFRTRTMQWMDRAAIVTHMDRVAADGMLGALDAHAKVESADLLGHGARTQIAS